MDHYFSCVPRSKTDRQNHRNINSKEDDLTQRQEEVVTGRRNHRNLNSPEADITKMTLRKDRKMTLACLASQSCTELGPAQPQLVLDSSHPPIRESTET